MSTKRKLDPQPQFIATNETLKKALDNWRKNKTAALQKYGKMSTWDTSGVTSMAKLFGTAGSTSTTFDNVNDIVSGWDVSNVTDMSYMFSNCNTFNQDLNGWDVSQVTTMFSMFSKCNTFDKPLNGWNVSNVTNMGRMFYECSIFNQPLDQWIVSNVTNMREMFMGCTQFNKPLNNWNVSNVTNTDAMFVWCRSMDPRNKPRVLQPVAHVEVNPLQVHQAASKINYEKLNEFFSTRTPQPITRPRNYANYIKNTINTLIDESDADPAKKEELTAGVQSIYAGRLGGLNFNETTSELLRDSIINSLEYVKLQSPVFKQVYVEAFVQDCIHAYDGADGMTCAGGALERIIFSLVPACISANETSETSDNPDYTTLIIIISGPEIIINSIKDWYILHNSTNQDNDIFHAKTTLEKKADLRNYLLGLYPNETALIDELIISYADSIGYDTEYFTFTNGGKRRNSRKRRKRRINNTRKRQKNKTKKTIHKRKPTH